MTPSENVSLPREARQHLQRLLLHARDEDAVLRAKIERLEEANHRLGRALTERFGPGPGSGIVSLFLEVLALPEGDLPDLQARIRRILDL